MLSGCATEKRCSRKYPPRESIDSIYIEREVISYVIDTVYIELPPLYIERFVDVKDTLRLKGAYSSAQSWVNGGKLLGWIKEGEKPVKIEYKKEYVDRVEYRDVTKETAQKVKYIPNWAKIFTVIGLIACFYLLIRLYLLLK
jgi:hypothetical protein